MDSWTAPLVNPIALSEAHLETSTLERTLPVLTELLEFRLDRHTEGGTRLTHTASRWNLVMHQAGPDCPIKHRDYHSGVRVASNEELRACHARVVASGAKLGISDITAPEFSHGAYQFYFREPGGNVWEIECFEDLLRREEAGGGKRLEGVRAPHWNSARPPAEDRAYAIQALTHGTLVYNNMHRSRLFYADVLGLSVIQATPSVLYVKHPATPHYIVCLCLSERNHYADDFRYTLRLPSRDDVRRAHARILEVRDDVELVDIGAMGEAGSTYGFILRDPDNNCWEISSADLSTGGA